MPDPTLLHELLTDGEALALWTAAVLAAAIGAWHLLGVALCTAARLWPRRAVLLRLTVLAPPVVRRAAGVACSASLVLAPAAAQAREPVARPPATDEPFVRVPAPPLTVSPLTVSPQPAPVPAAADPEPQAPAPVAPAPAGRSYEVVTGDNLWRIAADEITRVTGEPSPSDATIVPYWRAVIDANRTTLRSGDPSLIYAGEIVALPAP